MKPSKSSLSKSMPKHPFDVTSALLDAAGGAGFGSITEDDGLGFSARSGIRNSEIDAVVKSTTIRASLRRLMKSRGVLVVKRIQEAVRRLDAYQTGLFLSSFRARVMDDDGAPIRLKVTNDAPYAIYVHPKGTRPNQTIMRKVIPGILSEAKSETVVEIKALMRSPSVRRAVKAALLAGMR